MLGRRLGVSNTHQPHLEGRQLLLKELRGLVLLLSRQNVGKLRHDMVQGQVPGPPERVLVSGRERRVRLRGAVIGTHDPLGQQKIPEEARHK